MNDRMDRRGALRAVALAVPGLMAGRAWAQAPAGAAAQAPAAAPRAGQGEVGELFNPQVAGKPRVATTAMDNDEAIKRLEQKLQCTCGCTLDIYVCRTTDFTCEFSPALHRQVVAMAEKGMTEQQIIDAFVKEHGEKILMAPKAEGFNLAGYVVPGFVIALVGMLLTWIVLRRVRASQAVPAAVGGAPVPFDRTPGEAAPRPGASDAEMERLRRALEEIDA
jgi:cytochrome c-type biogenesis protein CcmH